MLQNPMYQGRMEFIQMEYFVWVMHFRRNSFCSDRLVLKNILLYCGKNNFLSSQYAEVRKSVSLQCLDIDEQQ